MAALCVVEWEGRARGGQGEGALDNMTLFTNQINAQVLGLGKGFGQALLWVRGGGMVRVSGCAFITTYVSASWEIPKYICSLYFSDVDAQCVIVFTKFKHI